MSIGDPVKPLGWEWFFINGSSIRTQDFILAWQTLDHEADVLNKFQKRVPKLC